MKKDGFTLSEALIALGIVAVAAAAIIPAVKNFTPDKNKTRVLELYSNIVQATNAIIEDQTLYSAPPVYNEDGSPRLNSNGTLVRACRGLACNQLPVVSPYRDDADRYSGAAKFPNLLSDRLGLRDVTWDGADRVLAGNVLNDKTQISIRQTDSGYSLQLTLDSRTNNCSYSNECTRKPNVFLFNIDNEGNVKAIDALTRAYIENPGKTSKKEDFLLAKGLLNSPVRLDDGRNEVDEGYVDVEDSSDGDGDGDGNSVVPQPVGPGIIPPDSNEIQEEHEMVDFGDNEKTKYKGKFNL